MCLAPGGRAAGTILSPSAPERESWGQIPQPNGSLQQPPWAGTGLG